MTTSIARLRRDAVDAFTAGVTAVQPDRLLDGAIHRTDDGIRIGRHTLPQRNGRRVLAAVGKAAPGLALAWLRLQPSWADEVLVIAPHGVPADAELARRALILRGAHPYPDVEGEAAARRLLERARELGADDLLVLLLSGGGSALLAAPVAGLALDDVATTTRALLEAGAPINAVNTVRRQLLAAAGGGLARAAAPATVVTLVLSDVIGDPVADIASGPTVPSPTTAADALAVLESYTPTHRVPEVVSAVLRRLAAHPQAASDLASRSLTHILGNNQCAVSAAAESLARAGYRLRRLHSPILGEARDEGRRLAALLGACPAGLPMAIVAGGETTVTVSGAGRGGRNHELALAAALELSDWERPAVLLSAGTDGIDGMTDAAGGVVDPSSAQRMRRAGIDPAAALAANDSGPALAAAGDSLHTGPTGTNVCDVMIALVAPHQGMPEGRLRRTT